MFNKPSGQVRIHTTIDRIDLDYCKKKNLKFAHLLRASIRDHKLHSGEDVAESAKEMQQSKERAINHRNKIIAAIRKLLGPERFDEFIQKI